MRFFLLLASYCSSSLSDVLIVDHVPMTATAIPNALDPKP